MNKILLVDDDPKAVEPLAIRLRAAGYTTITAIDGLKGLEVALKKRPDLIVMDIWMPEGAGILTAQRLKHFGLAHIPIIFLTGSRKEQVWPILEEVEPAGFFEKPYDSKEVFEAIRLLLSRSQVVAASI
jgi:DNA-binding response OmpR family regulator